MKNETELYRTAVSQLEEAATLLEQGDSKKAGAILYSMEEDVYEASLDMYSQNHKNIDYYRSRYVFASLEYDSSERPSRQDIEIYLLNWQSLSIQPKPKVVTVHSRRVIINQTSLAFA